MKTITPLDVAKMCNVTLVQNTGRELDGIDVSGVLPRIRKLVTRIVTLKVRVRDYADLKWLDGVVYRLWKASGPRDPLYEMGTPQQDLEIAISRLEEAEKNFDSLQMVKLGYDQVDDDEARDKVTKEMQFYPFVEGINGNTSSLLSDVIEKYPDLIRPGH